MNCRDASLLVLGTALTLAGHSVEPTEHSTLSATSPAVRMPDSEAARPAAGLISRADTAVRRYLEACRSNRDATDVVTSDARIEYSLDSPGAFLSLDASSIFASCASMGASGAPPPELWIFPTGEENAVFVQYETAASRESPAARQVALVEMRGDRIHRMRNFGAAPEMLLAVMHGEVQSELCAQLSWNSARLATNAMTIERLRVADSVNPNSVDASSVDPSSVEVSSP